MASWSPCCALPAARPGRAPRPAGCAWWTGVGFRPAGVDAHVTVWRKGGGWSAHDGQEEGDGLACVPTAGGHR
eukprot:364464-Chlamydomonas_euryale.AAC.13